MSSADGDKTLNNGHGVHQLVRVKRTTEISRKLANCKHRIAAAGPAAVAAAAAALLCLEFEHTDTADYSKLANTLPVIYACKVAYFKTRYAMI